VTEGILTIRRLLTYSLCMVRRIVSARTNLERADIASLNLCTVVAFLGVFIWFLWR